MAKHLYDAVATIGTYKDAQGVEKKRYMTIGKVFVSDKGNMSLKLEAVPVGQEWSGWVSFYEPKQYGQQTKKEDHAAKAAGDHLNDDIPF